MKIIHAPSEMQQTALEERRQGRRIALVPTMGALHEGHLSLIRLARREADVVVVSLFVNPTQFGPGEDFSRYPRDPEQDRAASEQAGADILFCPPVEAIYPAGFSAVVDEESLTHRLEGEQRPGHFRGVATVVVKLFHLVQPDVAVFGQKDAQQLSLVRRLIRDLNFPIRLVAGPTIREPDGLARSSRNAYLRPEHRYQAPVLYQALKAAEALYQRGERNAQAIRQAVRQALTAAPDGVPDYVDVVDPDTFEPVERAAAGTLVVLAVRFGETRLLDNIVFDPAGAVSRPAGTDADPASGGPSRPVSRG
jgi:pantoate--beta-alanine ligase